MLDRRKDGFNFPAAIVPAAAHRDVASVVERRIDAVLDQGTDAIYAEVTTERLPVIGSISSQRPQVAGIMSGDLRTDPRIVFLRGGAVDVGNVQRFDIDEGSDFQRPDAVVRPLGVVPRGGRGQSR